MVLIGDPKAHLDNIARPDFGILEHTSVFS
jgi:hypothetical protein